MLNYGRGCQISQDYNKAKTIFTALRDDVATPVELDPRQARSVAIQLLQAADEAEAQRQINLKRAREALRDGHVDAAAEIAEANGFTDAELNQEGPK